MKRLVALVVLFVGLGISAHAQVLTDRQVHDTLKSHQDALVDQAKTMNEGLKPRLSAAEAELNRLKNQRAGSGSTHDIAARQEGLLNIELYLVAVRGYTVDQAQAEAARIVSGNLSKAARRRLLVEASEWYKNAGPSQLIAGIERAMKTRFDAVGTRIGAVETKLTAVETTQVAHGKRLDTVEVNLKTLKEGLEKTVGDAVAAKLVGYYTKVEADKKVTEAITAAINHALANGLVTETTMSSFVNDALKGYATSKEVTVIRDNVIAAVRVVKEVVPHLKVRNVPGDHDRYRREKSRALGEIEIALKAAQAADEAELEAPAAPTKEPAEEEPADCPVPKDGDGGKEPPGFFE